MFYFMRSDPEQVRATVPENVSDWHGLALADYLTGPFEDRTGGLITFRADAAQQAVTTIRSFAKGSSRRTGSSAGIPVTPRRGRTETKPQRRPCERPLVPHCARDARSWHPFKMVL